MTKRNTKELILLKALTLFADKGYEGVSVRDIAAEVGIMQSSLYKHFQNKQDIFDSLIVRMRNQFQEASDSFQLPKGTFEKIAGEYAAISMDELKKMSTVLFLYYLKDPYASKFRRMLSFERYRNDEIDQIYRETYIETAVAYQSELFSQMIDQGIMREADPNVMALQFFSPIFVLSNKYDRMLDKEAEAIAELKKHIDQFDMLYRKEPSK